MAYKKQLKERGTDISIYPITRAECVLESDGTDINTYVNSITNELEDTINTHTHNLGDLKHIPLGGSENLILVWKENGDALWSNLTDILPEVELILAYGVEWNTNLLDPHLTRIGNMTFHKTLPIQSQLKGCVAYRDTIKYWLDENDWNFRKDPVYILGASFASSGTFCTTFDIASLSIKCFVGLKVRMTDASEGFLRAKGVITEITDGVASITWDRTDDSGGNVELGSRLDGYDGTVQVYCPEFYIKSYEIGNIRRVLISSIKIDSSWTKLPSLLIDAYKSTILNKSVEDMGLLSYEDSGTAISVVNTNDYCRGGSNRSESDMFLTETDYYKSDLGKPRTNISRLVMRSAAKLSSSQVLSYEQYKNIFYWLYVIEYANFNCQEAYTEELTAEGFKLGGLGNGVTTTTYLIWNNLNLNNPIVPCGYCNEFGNRTSVKPLTWNDGISDEDKVFLVPRWRGFDNPFGDTFTMLDGCVLNDNTFYVTINTAYYSDSVPTYFNRAIKECSSSNHFIEEFNLGEAADIIPKESENTGSETIYKCDYHWTASGGPHILMVSGSASDGSIAGIGTFSTIHDTNLASSTVGFRTVRSVTTI